MKIALVTSAILPPTEGIGYYVESLARQYRLSGHDVTVISRKGRFRDEGSSHSDTTRVELPLVPIPPFHADALALQLKRVYERTTPSFDLIHYHSPLVPYVRSGAPTLATFHSPMHLGVHAMDRFSMQYIASRFMLSTSSLRLERNLLKSTDFVATVSDSVTNALCSAPYHADRRKVKTIGNGVDTDCFAPDETQRVEKSVFWAGRLVPGKGVEELVEAARVAISQDPGIRFRIAGEGALREYVARAIQKDALQNNIALLGRLKRSRMIDEYRKASILLITSHYEGMPTVLLEGMACETPCLCTRVGGAPEVIRDGDNGYLIGLGNPREIADRITSVLGERASVRQLVGKRARGTVLKNHSWQIIGRRYQDALERITEAEVKE